MIGWQRICCAVVYAAATIELDRGQFPVEYTDDATWFRSGLLALTKTEALIWWYTTGDPNDVQS